MVILEVEKVTRKVATEPRAGVGGVTDRSNALLGSRETIPSHRLSRETLAKACD
jgi:hypothetical protein